MDSLLSVLDGEWLQRSGQEMYALAQRLYPICRSITGEGVRQTLRILGERIPVELHEVPSGTPVYDWTVPKEWNIREAWIEDPEGRRIVDFQEHNLHVVNYSVPVDRRLTLAELQPHLHSIPEQPDWIPYRTSYYNESWGFCLTDRQRRSLAEGSYRVRIDSRLEAGSLTYGESFLPGPSGREVLIYTHTCHPSLANDNVAGLAVVSELCRLLKDRRHRLGYRFVLGPGTIGSLSWLSRNEHRLSSIAHGLVAGLLGDPGALTYKKSRRGVAHIDRAASHVVSMREGKVVDFGPYGYDERQFCSPGFDLPVGRLTRSPNSGYAEYHTSADDLALVNPECLADSLGALVRIIDVLERDRYYRNLSPKGEPQLGKRGLYRKMGGDDVAERELAMLWTLNLSDGDWSLLDIAERSSMPFSAVADAAEALRTAGLLQEVG